jgi:hypothetical protein
VTSVRERKARPWEFWPLYWTGATRWLRLLPDGRIEGRVAVDPPGLPRRALMVSGKDRAWWAEYVQKHPHVDGLRNFDDPPPDLDGFDSEAWIAGEEWRFAKTMPRTPHWYVMLHFANDPHGLIRFYYLILEQGYWRPWYRSRYRTMIIGDYGYWVMSTGVPPGSIVNRADAAEMAPPPPEEART